MMHKLMIYKVYTD